MRADTQCNSFCRWGRKLRQGVVIVHCGRIVEHSCRPVVVDRTNRLVRLSSHRPVFDRMLMSIDSSAFYVIIDVVFIFFICLFQTNFFFFILFFFAFFIISLIKFLLTFVFILLKSCARARRIKKKKRIPSLN